MEGEYISLNAGLWIGGVLVTIIAGLIGFIAKHIVTFNKLVLAKLEGEINSISAENKEKIEGILSDQITVNKSMKEIKENYLSRFEKITKLITDGNLQLTEKINDLRVDMIRGKKNEI